MYPQFESGTKKAWSTDEDHYLIRLVHKYGAQKWTLIAEHLPGKGRAKQDVSVNSAGNDGTTTLAPTLIKKSGLAGRSGCCFWLTAHWATAGPKFQSRSRDAPITPSKITGTPRCAKSYRLWLKSKLSSIETTPVSMQWGGKPSQRWQIAVE